MTYPNRYTNNDISIAALEELIVEESKKAI